MDEEESKRVVQKRRTSSDLPEEARIVVRIPRGEVEEHPVAHPKRYTRSGSGWRPVGGPRRGNADDPLVVDKYVDEIFTYLKVIEVSESRTARSLLLTSAFQKTTVPNPNYMEMQMDLVWKMRGLLTGRLIQIHSRFRLLPETLFLCVNTIDRFLSARIVSLIKLQLVGITCMSIATKVEEII